VDVDPVVGVLKLGHDGAARAAYRVDDRNLLGLDLAAPGVAIRLRNRCAVVRGVSDTGSDRRIRQLDDYVDLTVLVDQERQYLRIDRGHVHALEAHDIFGRNARRGRGEDQGVYAQGSEDSTSHPIPPGGPTEPRLLTETSGGAQLRPARWRPYSDPQVGSTRNTYLEGVVAESKGPSVAAGALAQSVAGGSYFQ
jgi:hypothetical protein